MRVRWRSLARLVPVLLLAVLSMFGEHHFARNDSQAITAKPVAFDADDAGRERSGALVFLGGWELESDNSDFGGFSALTRLPDGRFLAITDSGRMAAFDLVEGETRAAARLEDVFIGVLPGAVGFDEAGEELDYRHRDSESVTRDAAGRRYWVGYENFTAIRRFDADFLKVSAIARPPQMKDWPRNGGPEALVRLADGRFIVFAEAATAEGGGTEALVFAGDPTRPGVAVGRFAYLPPDGYRVTDAAQIPDGRLLLLHRRLGLPGGFTALLALIDADDIAPGASVVASPVARLAPPLAIDNMEGLYVEETGGRTVVWLISDDNHIALQRTLLLKFALDAERDSGDDGDGGPGGPGFSSR